MGPQTWVGIDPDGNVWVPDVDGNGENLGEWQTWVESTALVGIGSCLMAWGAGTFAAGCGGSAVLIADDLTVVGVADDPLLLLTGGVTVVGGVAFIVGGIANWLGF